MGEAGSYKLLAIVLNHCIHDSGAYGYGYGYGYGYRYRYRDK